MALREIEEGLVTASILDEKEESSDLMMESLGEETGEGEKAVDTTTEETAAEQPSEPKAE